MSLDPYTCQYTDEYYDTRTGDFHNYQCRRPPLSLGGFCGFHNENYFQSHQDEIRSIFLDELDSSEPELFFVGCHMPEVTIQNLRSKSSVYFVNAKFHGTVTFSNVEFSSLNFRLAKFFNNSKFRNLHVLEFFDFTDAKYTNLESSNSRFSNSVFEGMSKFTRAHLPSTEFVECTFKNSNFRETTFHQAITIKESTFYSLSDFSASIFNANAFFLFSSFHSNTLFAYADFNHIVEFKNVDFKEQKLVTFSRNLSNVSFLGTDITRTKFDERTIWYDSDRYLILDARRLIETPEKYGLSSVLAVYRNLRENYEFRLMYEEAGQFFVKEMELKKKYFEDPKNDYVTKLKPIRHRLLSLNSFYSYLCKYGESFSRPVIWAGIVFLLAGSYYWLNPDLPSIAANYSLNTIDEASNLLGDPNIKLRITVERTLAAFFQIDSNELVDYLVRISSIPILGALFIVLRRKFERRFRH